MLEITTNHRPICSNAVNVYLTKFAAIEPMRVYPDNALSQLEFDKIKTILLNYCQSTIGKEQVEAMRIHTHLNYIQITLRQTQEYQFIKQANQYFPSDFHLTLFLFNL